MSTIHPESSNFILGFLLGMFVSACFVAWISHISARKAPRTSFVQEPQWVLNNPDEME